MEKQKKRMYIFKKNKSGYVLLSAIVFLTIYSGLVFQIEQNRQAHITDQTRMIEANEGRMLCNVLILKRKTNKDQKSIISSIGTAKIEDKKIVVLLKNHHCFKFQLRSQPL